MANSQNNMSALESCIRFCNITRFRTVSIVDMQVQLQQVVAACTDQAYLEVSCKFWNMYM